MASQLNPYLSFKDNARDAMTFYQSVFGGDLNIATFADFHAVPEGSPEANNVMHSELKGANGITFMASDTPSHMEYQPGASISMSLSGTDEAELSGYFQGLSQGGRVDVPLAPAPWGDSFGMVTDKFGVRWLVNIGRKDQQ